MSTYTGKPIALFYSFKSRASNIIVVTIASEENHAEQEKDLSTIIEGHPRTLYTSAQTTSAFYEPTSHATPPDPLDRLLALNRLYAQHTTAQDPNAFVNLAKGQAPEILWLGCSDSRLSESTICQCKPGDIFVHRNIANTVHADDINSASVVEYAVAHLKVKKVVVCGHTKCGGATAALGDADLGQTLNTWLHPVRE
jgi:hypothetical protein